MEHFLFRKTVDRVLQFLDGSVYSDSSEFQAILQKITDLLGRLRFIPKQKSVGLGA